MFHVQCGEQVLRLGQLGFGPLTITPSDRKLRLGSSGLGPEAISLPFHELHLVLELQLVLGEACVRLGKLHTVGGAYFDSGDQHQGGAPSSGGESPLVTFPLPPIPRGVWTARCLDTSSKKGERSAPLLRTYRDELEAKRGVSSHRRSPSD